MLVWFAVLFRSVVADPTHTTLFGGLNLGLHEIGHYLFLPFGDFLTVAGGTLFQLAAPVITAVLFFRQGDFFAVSVAVFWLGLSACEVAVYAADGPWQLLPLVSPGPGRPVHDWNYLLRATGLMESAGTVAGIIRFLGLAAMAAGIAAGAWVLRIMAASNREA